MIIPTYNRASMLRQAIHSVLAQTYDDLELIVVDDGSTDGTREMVATIHDSRVRYIWQENQERSIARNNGVLEATGELLGFLDSDDLWLPNKLAGQVELIDKHSDAVLVYGSVIHINDHNLLVNPLDLINQSDEPEVRDWANDLLYGCPLTSISMLMRRSAFEDTGGFDPSLSFSEDWDLWIRLSELGSFCSVHSPVSAVRVHSSRSINDISASLQGSLDVVEKTLTRRAEKDSKIRARAELGSYLRHAVRAVDLDTTSANDWIASALSRSAILNYDGVIKQAFVSRLLANGCSFNDWRIRSRSIERAVRLINTLGGTESKRDWLGAFWCAAVHAAKAIGDNRLILQACFHLLGCSGTRHVDRGVMSSVVRAALALARHPGFQRQPLPQEKEIASFVAGLLHI